MAADDLVQRVKLDIEVVYPQRCPLRNVEEFLTDETSCECRRLLSDLSTAGGRELNDNLKAMKNPMDIS